MDTRTDRKCVMVVDDTPENIDVIRGLLSNEYRVKVATNGYKALEIARASIPDLILLDIMMPRMDGYEVCRFLKEDIKLRQVPVIFLTARNQEEDQTKGFAVGAVDYITKPISPPVLLARVQTHLALYDQSLHLEMLVRRRTKELHDTRLKIIQKLGVAAEFKDNETGTHVIRMSMVCRLLALAMGVAEDEAEMIFQAAPMHDVGKIGIPDNILLKPSRLDEEEWGIMQTHTTIGAKIIGSEMINPLTLARTIALTHHEKWDGTGYPRGMEGEEIPLEGRIVAIADVFDALVNQRPYKKAWRIGEAVGYIESEAGKHFDPGMIPVFIDVLPEIKDVFEELN